MPANPTAREHGSRQREAVSKEPDDFMPDGLVALTTVHSGIFTVLVSLLAIKMTRDMSPMVAGWNGRSLSGSCSGIALAWPSGQG